MLFRIAALAGLGLAAAFAVTPAMALSSHDCSVKYKAAQDAGTLNGMKYADFRKASCGADATLDSPPATTAAAAPSADAGSEPNIANTELGKEPAAPATTAAPRGVVFPRAIDTKYAKESPGRQRMHTCLDQYRTNKANNALGGLKWIQKGGGYYSICNARLKAS